MKQLSSAFRASLVLLLLCGLIYPLLTTGIAEAIFPRQAEGSLLQAKGTVIGSELIAQDFQAPQFFHPRSLAATQAAVASPDYVTQIAERVQTLHQENPALTEIPADLVTASGSGLDPDLSPEAAKAQIPRIAKATGLRETMLNQLVDDVTRSRALGLFGEPRVNVLELNRELLLKRGL